MFGGNQPQGFTIIEILIFLTVSGILFLSVMNLINGSQNRTQWNEGIHEIFSEMQSLTNDVQIGYYNTGSQSFTCNPGAGTDNGTSPVTVTAGGGDSEGGHSDCTFMGRSILFSPSASTNTYIVQTIVGRQFDTATPPNLVNNISDANLNTIYTLGSVPLYNLTTVVTLPPDTKISAVYFKDSSLNGGNPVYDNYIGFLSSFPGGTPNNPASGELSSNLVPIPTFPLAVSTSPLTVGIGLPTAQKAVQYMQNNGTTDGNGIYSANGSGLNLSCDDTSHVPPCTIMNPDEGVEICIQDTANTQVFGIITVGGNSGTAGTVGNPLSTQLTFHDGATCTT